jgi:formiminotetrahydrofolate cyclodeaminase
MYADESIRTYLKDLAARKPAPGGGSAAALSGAVGVSLMSMVCGFTIGNPKYKDVEDEAKEILKKCEAARQGLEKLIDEDVEAYGKLSKAIKESAKDGRTPDGPYKDALKPPFEICRIAASCLKLCGRLADIGNKNLVTDTAIAAILLEGAFFSAKYNVYINLKYIKDMGWVGCIHEAIAPLEESVPKMKEEIIEKCEEIIQK